MFSSLFYEPPSLCSGFTLRQEAVAFGHKTEFESLFLLSACYSLVTLTRLHFEQDVVSTKA